MPSSVTPDSVDILIVEDDDIDVEAVRRGFKKQNIANRLFHASNGVDALEILRGNNEQQKISQPCVLLVDINMPQMNGLEFLKEMRSDETIRKNIAFILTTSARGVDIDVAYELNVAGYFLKEDIGKLMGMLGFYREINKFGGR